MTTHLAAKKSGPKPKAEWKYLSRRPDGQGVDLYVLGTRLPASSVWISMVVNDRTVEETAWGWDIPVEAVEECIRFCELHEEELGAEFDRIRRDAEAGGIRIEPPPLA
jgi:hypothetical protein